ncbi:MAG: TIGR04255 family protein [Methanoregula sp.]|nr:TIGR04255 family protein [Methanoregula sp.]
MKFKNPPIVEAICEFRFSQESKTDPTIPGLLYEKLKTDFPNKESKIDQEIEIKADDKGFRHWVKNPNSLAVFLSNDRKSLIQIGTNKLSIHYLKPYPGWEHFRPKIQQAFDALNSITAVQRIDRIALVYIDKIEIPGHNIDLKQYFNFMPHLGEGFAEPFTDFMVGCDIPYNSKRDICKLQLTSAMPDSKANSAYLLTTEYFLAKKKAITKNGALEWVENAHTVVHSTFLNCITKKLEDQFERIE